MPEAEKQPAAAEAALAKRGEKMASPDYHGTGGGTSMEEAYAYVESLLAGTEQAEESTTQNTVESDAVSYLRANHYTEDEISGMLSEDVWNHQRESYVRTGNGAPEVSAYSAYEDYVKAYIQYLSEQ